MEATIQEDKSGEKRIIIIEPSYILPDEIIRHLTSSTITDILFWITRQDGSDPWGTPRWFAYIIENQFTDLSDKNYRLCKTCKDVHDNNPDVLLVPGDSMPRIYDWSDSDIDAAYSKYRIDFARGIPNTAHVYARTIDDMYFKVRRGLEVYGFDQLMARSFDATLIGITCDCSIEDIVVKYKYRKGTEDIVQEKQLDRLGPTLTLSHSIRHFVSQRRVDKVEFAIPYIEHIESGKIVNDKPSWYSISLDDGSTIYYDGYTKIDTDSRDSYHDCMIEAQLALMARGRLMVSCEPEVVYPDLQESVDPVTLKHRISQDDRWGMTRGMPTYSFFKYFPTSVEQVGEDAWKVRNLVWDFKDGGEDYSVVYHCVLRLLKDTFSREELKEMSFFCIPSSSEEAYMYRYELFSDSICSALGMRNAYSWVKYVSDGEASHLGGNVQADIRYDKRFFRYKNVILFDDVVTTGRSIEKTQNALESLGASVICAITIARTHHDY